jgi:Mlc titration factor MtfA (ptsG expression regulator)
VRATPPPASRLIEVLTAASALALLVLVAVVAGWWGAGGTALALALAADVARRRRARYWRGRLRAITEPFPERWRAFLERRYDHYGRLPADLRARFEDDVRLFLMQTRITGVDIAVQDEMRLLVAASAVTLSLCWPDYEWSQVQEVLLYPGEFSHNYRVGREDLAGQAHPWGTVILSVPALRDGFRDPDDGRHVGLHEFVHLLDLDHTHFDGLPAGFSDSQARRWVEVREAEMERMRQGLSILDVYGAHDPVEFLAVAVETFFERALALRAHNPDLYGLLAAYFGQDPAAWDDARGLEV